MNVWIEAARPKTLPAALTPVLVGTAASRAAASGPRAGEVHAGRALLALVVALALQVAVNYANDYFDGVSGVDTAARTGPRRAVAAGLVAPTRMKRAVVAALAVAGLAGAALAALVGAELLLVGIVAMLAALGYSGGRVPYASRGLGELAVFVFFGLVATVGSQYVQDGRVGTVAVLAAVPVGFVAVAILVANNLRDIPTDEVAGKRTLAVRLGERRTRSFFVGLLYAALLWAVVLAAATGQWLLLLAPLLPLPLAARAARTVRSAPLGPRLVPALEATGQLHLAYGILLAAGLLLRGPVGG